MMPRRRPRCARGHVAIGHPADFTTRLFEAGCRSSMSGGLMGLGTRLPPQLGQRPARTVSAQVVQKVHSKVQMRASIVSGGRSRSQHSQFGRSSSTNASTCVGPTCNALHCARDLRDSLL